MWVGMLYEVSLPVLLAGGKKQLPGSPDGKARATLDTIINKRLIGKERRIEHKTAPLHSIRQSSHGF